MSRVGVSTSKPVAIFQPTRRLRPRVLSAACGGSKAELYDLVALRTEPGAARQKTFASKCAPGGVSLVVHLDAGLRNGTTCTDLPPVRPPAGAYLTVFLPGTHKQTVERLAICDGAKVLRGPA